MIDAIIFDFGDIFINIDNDICMNELKKLGLKEWNDDLANLNVQYETGKIDELEFFTGFQKHIPNHDVVEIRAAWNTLLQDFPLERLEFLQMITSKYKLYLLSNTDRTHIEKFEHKFGMSFARDFYSCFEKVYFSFEFGFRKPDEKAFQPARHPAGSGPGDMDRPHTLGALHGNPVDPRWPGARRHHQRRGRRHR